jgi:type I restriction enzyme R subunit
MKQAIEGFILDVLKTYTPIDSYYKLIKRTSDDPEFDTKKAKKKMRHYVESHNYAIRLKAESCIDHFHEQVHVHQQNRWSGAGNGDYQRD